jgi:hypothetical protein
MVRRSIYFSVSAVVALAAACSGGGSSNTSSSPSSTSSGAASQQSSGPFSGTWAGNNPITAGAVDTLILSQSGSVITGTVSTRSSQGTVTERYNGTASGNTAFMTFESGTPDTLTVTTTGLRSQWTNSKLGLVTEDFIAGTTPPASSNPPSSGALDNTITLVSGSMSCGPEGSSTLPDYTRCTGTITIRWAINAPAGSPLEIITLSPAHAWNFTGTLPSTPPTNVTLSLNARMGADYDDSGKILKWKCPVKPTLGEDSYDYHGTTHVDLTKLTFSCSQ